MRNKTLIINFSNFFLLNRFIMCSLNQLLCCIHVTTSGCRSSGEVVLDF